MRLHNQLIKDMFGILISFNVDLLKRASMAEQRDRRSLQIDSISGVPLSWKMYSLTDITHLINIIKEMEKCHWQFEQQQAGQ